MSFNSLLRLALPGTTVYVQIFEGCNFVDCPNLGFPRFYFRGSLVITPCTLSVLQQFYNLNFVDDKLPAKTAKFTSLKNLYVYGIFRATDVATVLTESSVNSCVKL